MSIIDSYMNTLDVPERDALERIRRFTNDQVPDAEEGKSYGMPAFKYQSRPLIGFIAAKNHLSLYPFSPRVIDALKGQLDDYDISKGTIRFSIKNPITDEILKQIIDLRLNEIVNPRR